MFNNKKIERLKRRIEELVNREISLRGELTENRVLRRWMRSENDTTYKAISLEELQKTQERIMDYLNVELKTTSEKTELVSNMKDKGVCAPEFESRREEIKLDKRENRKVCPKCNGKRVSTMYIPKDSPGEYEHLEKYCECGYGWIESCLDVKKKEVPYAHRKADRTR